MGTAILMPIELSADTVMNEKYLYSAVRKGSELQLNSPLKMRKDFNIKEL